MQRLDDHHTNILIASFSETVANRIDLLLTKYEFQQNHIATCINEVKQALIQADFDIVIIDTPFPEEDITEYAIGLSRSKDLHFSIILLEPSDSYKRNLYQAEKLGIITLKKPVDPELFIHTIHLILAFRSKIKQLETNTSKLQQKLEDDRMVNRAKLLLVENLKMSEQEAHHYIEKRAMATSQRKAIIAYDIINRYQK